MDAVTRAILQRDQPHQKPEPKNATRVNIAVKTPNGSPVNLGFVMERDGETFATGSFTGEYRIHWRKR